MQEFFKIEFASQDITAFGGLELIRRYFRLIKLGRTVRSVFARYDVGGDYRAIDMILVIVVLILVGGHKGSELPGSFVKIPSATKIRILFFYSFNVGYSQEEENRLSEKLHSTLNVSRQKGAGLSPAPHCGESDGLRGGGRGLILRGLSTTLNRADGARLIGEHQAQKASQELLPRRPILSCLK